MNEDVRNFQEEEFRTKDEPIGGEQTVEPTINDVSKVWEAEDLGRGREIETLVQESERESEAQE